jgi:hypothetical protein
MKNIQGDELIKLNIQNGNFLFFEIRNKVNECVYPCTANRTAQETIDCFESVCETLPPGVYSVILGKDADIEKGRVKRQPSGGAGATNTLTIFAPKSHIDVNSHNATAIQPVGFKEYENIRNEVERLRIELLKAELKASEPKEKEDGIFDKIMASPHSEQMINALVLGVTNLASNLFIPPQQNVINGNDTGK